MTKRMTDWIDVKPLDPSILPNINFRHNNSKYNWTKEEISYLFTNYPFKTTKEIAFALNRSVKAIKSLVLSMNRRGYLRRKKCRQKTELCLIKFKDIPQNNLLYLCGIIDGEGTITLAKSANQNWRPTISVNNTDPLLINWLNQYFFEKPYSTYNTHGRPYCKVQLTGYGILPILTLLEPYLICKKLQCQLLIRFINLRDVQSRKDKPTSEMREIVDDIKKLNSRGEGSDKLKQVVREKYSILTPSILPIIDFNASSPSNAFISNEYSCVR